MTSKKMQGEISCQIAQQQYAIVVKSLKLIVIIYFNFRTILKIDILKLNYIEIIK